MKCQNCSKEFIIAPEDFRFYQKFDISPPKKCSVCMWKHLLSFWVFGRFRKTISALSGKSIITTFPETIRFPIYNYQEWVSDAWDPLDLGIEHDSSKSFFKQLIELQSKVPHPHQSGTKNTQCQWSDDVWNSKNCYLCRSLLDCENVSYGYRTFGCKDSIDLTYCFDTVLSYDCLYCFKCYKTKYSFDARNCIDSYFLHDCRNCQNCFMCWNLRNKKYHILNQSYSREEYFEKIKEFDTRSYQGVQKLKKEFKKIIADKAIHRANYNVKTVNSTGNFLVEDKDCFSCYFLEKSENCRYVFRGINNKDTIWSVGSIIENSILSAVDGYVYQTLGTSHCANCRYSMYLDYCEDCEYCFGCVGLRKKKFCILNKQYSEKEYYNIAAKIKEKMIKDGEWGEFFPITMAYCGYNFSLANIYFPQNKEEVLTMGGFWEEPAEQIFEGINGDTIPDNIDAVSDEISQKVIICPITKRRFNIARHELDFYKSYGIPLPHNHSDYRTIERFNLLAMMATTHQNKCYFCSKDINHFYSSELGYKKIACEDCYLREVV